MTKGHRLGTTLALACTLALGLGSCAFVDAFKSQSVQIPAEYMAYFRTAANRCPGVLTPHGLAAQAYVESGFNPQAVSRAGAQGLMQIMPNVWATYGQDANGDGVKDPFTPSDSIATSAVINCALVDELKSVKGDQTSLRLAAYNAGPSAVLKYSGIPPFPETQDYVKQVIDWTDDFKDQFNPPSQPPVSPPASPP